MEKIEQLLSDLRVEAAESRVHLAHISEHLAKLNGRTQKSEEKISLLDTEIQSAKKAWTAVVAIASGVGATLSWLYNFLSK